MQPFPHQYSVSAEARDTGDVTLRSHGAADLPSHSPPEFGGPGGRWSPESLLVASVGDCVVLTFRALARTSRYPFDAIRVDVDGTLDRVERVTSFTAFRVRAHLTPGPGADIELGKRLVCKAKEQCLITHSLKAPSTFEVVVGQLEPAACGVTA
jgi:organic hydroperoxide reductase OsmC/OhrA